ncbi:MAG: tetratricopeptide repeat protein [Deltaproteobacteria bacterium]|nr:tetratricopeptide repeat protein [Deltaproteobacteria bacterium]
MKKQNSSHQTSLFDRELHSLCVAAFFFAAAFLLYFKTLDNPLVFDSASHFNNGDIMGGLRNFSFLNVRAFPLLSYALIYKFLGQGWAWQRVFNIFLHASNALLVYIFLRGLFCHVLGGKSKSTSVNPAWIAFFAGLIFLIHPVSVYATAYLVQRSIQMGLAFGLLSLIFYLKGVLSNRWYWFLPAAFFYFFCVHSKEHCVTLPAVALMVTLMLDPFSVKKYLKKYFWVYLLFAAISTEIILSSKGYLGKIYEPHGIDMINNAVVQGEALISQDNAYFLSVMTQTHMFFRYLFLWLIPLPHLIYIDIHLPFAAGFLSWPETFTAFCFCVFVLFSLWLLVKKGLRSLFGFALLSPVVLFSTEMSVVRLSEQFVLYRSYFWVIGLVSVLPLLVFWIAKNKKAAPFILATFFVYLVLLVFVTLDRLKTFDSEIALWRDVVEKVDRTSSKVLYKNYRPFNNLANKLTDIDRFDEALQYYMIGLKLNPNYGLARANMGIMYYKQGKYDEAMTYYRDAIEKEPGYLQSYIGLGLCFYKQGKYQEAIDSYNRVLKIRPSDDDAHFNLGNAFYKLRDYQKAIAHYVKALSLNPNLEDVYYNLALAYLQNGQHQESLEQFNKIVTAQPDHKRKADACFEMANIYFRLKDFDRAARYYQMVIDVNPKMADAHYNLGIIYLNKGERALAKTRFEKAVDIDPAHQKSLNALKQF